MSEINIGEELKQRREEQKLTLKEVSEKLKIHQKDIGFLEDNSFEKMTKHIYLSGLVRSYCKLLKIENDLTQKYVEAASQFPGEEKSKRRLLNFNQRSNQNPSKEHLLNALLILIITYLILIFLSGSDLNSQITDLIINQLNSGKI